MDAVVDNDIMLKGACYGILSRLVSCIPASADTVGSLGAARYVVTAAIRRQALNGDARTAEARFLEFLARAQTIEPSQDEVAFAAELEFHAQRENLPLDAGESQLCAVLIHRELPAMATGDKRAIASIEKLLDVEPKLGFLAGRLVCLEQLVLQLLTEVGLDELRSAICGEPAVDKALALCFSCSSPSIPESSCAEGLRSYIRDVRASAERVLDDRMIG